MLVRDDASIEGTVGGGAIEEAVRGEAAQVLKEGRPRLFAAHLSRDLAMCCGGRMEIFLEPVGLPPWLLLFGGGHVGRAVCEAATLAGFRVHLVDERPDYGRAESHPRAAVITCDEPLSVLDTLPFSDDAFVVITTHNHRLDEALLSACLARPHRYLGMIGSRAKVHRFVDRAAHRGELPDALRRSRSPIGLDLGGREPGEIAISIVAELIAVRRRGPILEARAMTILEEVVGRVVAPVVPGHTFST